MIPEAAKGSKDTLKLNFVSFLRRRVYFQKLIERKRAAVKTNETKKIQILAEIEKLKKETESIDKRVKERSKEIETTTQQLNQSETIYKTLVKVIDDKNNVDILDQDVVEETKSLVESVYKTIYQ